MARKLVKKREVIDTGSSKNTHPGILVSERVQLRDVRLWKYACEQQPKACIGRKRKYKITHSATFQIDKKVGRICVFPEFHFEAFSESERDKSILLIRAVFLLVYEIDDFEGIDKAGFQVFADLNGIYNAWPYWREIVQNTIARMGLPTLVIPVFRIVGPREHRSGVRPTLKK